MTKLKLTRLTWLLHPLPTLETEKSALLNKSLTIWFVRDSMIPIGRSIGSRELTSGLIRN